MEEKEEKGFTVKDRRKVSMDDAERETGTEQTQEQTNTEQERTQAGTADALRKDQEQESVPLPEVTLATFIFSLSSSALLHLGEIPDPETNQVQVHLPLAKHVIDTLGMLQEKTKGNLDPDEDNLLKSVLYDLRLRYVQKSTK